MNKLSYILALWLFCLTNSFAIDYTFNPSKGVMFSWNTEDNACAYTENNNRLVMWGDIVEADKHTSHFNFYGWTMVANTPYYAYYPYSVKYVQNGNTLNALPVSYKGQKQTANADLSHLSAYDYMHAKATTTTEDQLTFDFEHYGAILRFAVYIPTTTTFTKLQLDAGSKKMISAANMNLLEGTLNTTEEIRTLEMDLDNIRVEAGDSLVAYIMIAPKDYTYYSFNTKFLGDHSYSASCKACNIEAGKVYNMPIQQPSYYSPNQAKPVSYKNSRELTITGKETVINATGDVTNPYGTGKDFEIDNTMNHYIDTGIEEVIIKEKDNKIYDLLGRRVNLHNQQKGQIFIINGNKYLVR